MFGRGIISCGHVWGVSGKNSILSEISDHEKTTLSEGSTCLVLYSEDMYEVPLIPCCMLAKGSQYPAVYSPFRAI